MTITLLTAHGTSTTSNSASITLPAGIPANSWGYLVIAASAPNATPSIAGWALVDSGATGPCACWLFVRSVGVADSSTVVSAPLAGSARWNIGVVVASGENLDLISAATTTTSYAATQTVPAITPIKNDCMDLLIGGLAGNTNLGTVAVTPPSGFTEDLDYSSAVGTANDLDVYAAHRQLTGQAGTVQTATSTSTSPAARAVLWRLTLAPGLGTERLRDARLSARVLIGPPQKLRIGRLSAQVLTRAAASTSPTTGQIWPRTWPSTHGTVLTVGQLWPRGRP